MIYHRFSELRGRLGNFFSDESGIPCKLWKMLEKRQCIAALQRMVACLGATARTARAVTSGHRERW